MAKRKPKKDLAPQKAVLKELQTMPGVGPSISQDLYALGIRAIADLKGQNPQMMYEKSCAIQGVRVDRCLLYVYRCAVYFASHDTHDSELLKWWHWKDQRNRQEGL